MRTTRRTFLGSAAAASSVAGFDLLSPAAAAAAVDGSFDPWVEVHAGNLHHNVTEIARHVGGRPILAVIKNNGYGAGVVRVAQLLEPTAAVAALAVVKLHEAMALRDAGIRKPILLMGPADEKELGEVVARGVTPMVYTPVGEALERLARTHQRDVGIHVCVDTGIGRVGVPHTSAASLVRDLAGRKGTRLEGVMMTFSEDPDFDKVQLARFEALCATLRTEGINLGRRHAASSYGLFQRQDAFLDMVRPGMAIFGVYPEQVFRKTGLLALRPALALRARVIYAKRLRQGESAGYNRAYVAREDVWVATLPVGHADGWPRQAAKGARIRIGARMYPVVASVSASHTIVEIGPEPLVQVGDVATLFDWQDGSRPEDVNAACDASVYDLTMHLNPLLPRRVIE